MEKEISELIKKAKKAFPKLFINDDNEIIFEPVNNLFFRLEDVENELNFKCKVLAWLSRPSCKGLKEHWQKKCRNGVNAMLGTDFSKEDMQEIYTYLGNDVNRMLSEKFIQSNYDMSLLKREAETEAV